MKPKFPLHAAFLTLAFAPAAFAADGTWNVNADGLWITPGNWTPGIADGSGSTANFTNNITADRTVHLDGDRTLTNVVFSDSDTATAGSWILDNNGTSTNNLILAGTTPTITVNALGTGKTATISAEIQGTVGLTKAGVGTLILSGANSYTGNTSVINGTLTVSGSGVITSGGQLTVDTVTSSSPTFTYSSGGSSNFSAVTVGNGGSRTGTLNQSNGTINATTLSLGNGANSGGIVNLSGGSMILSSSAEVGKRAATNWVSQMNVSSTGSLSAASMTVAPNSFSNGDSAGHLQVTGGSVTLTGNLTLGGTDTGRHSAYATLSGGTTTVASVVGGNGANTNKFLYFNGGVLRPQADSINFISGLNGAYVYGGGATIDTTDKTITIGQNLLGTSGTGVRSITTGTYGSGFTPSTTLLVTFETPAGGRPATAWVSTNATGNITGIVSVVDQGTGYTGSGALNVTAGAGSATIPFANLTYGLPNLSGGTGITSTGGGLTKRGIGSLTLSGTNSYTGDTNVNNGSLTVSGNQSAATGSWMLRGYGDTGSTFNTVATTTTFGTTSTVSVASGKTVQLGNNAASGGFQLQTLNANGTATNAGTLFVGRSGSFNVGGAWTQNGAATVATQGGGTAAMSVTNSGSFTYGSGTEFQINSTGSTNTNTNLTINGGLLTTGVKFHNASTSVVTGSSSGIILADGGTLKLSANVSDLFTTAGATNRFVLNSGDGIIDTAEFSTTLNVPISGAGSLTKQGSGTLTLSGSGSYTGNTTITGGSLALTGTGSISASPVISVKSGATLDVSGVTGGNWSVGASQKLTGSGGVTGATTISGKHNAGDAATNAGVGSQAFSSSLTYANGSIFEWDINANKNSTTGTAGTDFDNVTVTGNLNGSTGGDTSIFRVIFGTIAKAGINDSGNAFWNTAYGTQEWSMTSLFGKNFTSGLFTSVETYDSTGVFDVSSKGSFTITGTSLTWTAVPEPTSALAGLLITAGLLRRRRA